MKTQGGIATLLLAVTMLVMHIPTHSEARKLPPQFQQCKRHGPEVNSCLRESFEKSLVIIKDGMSELQLLPTDPLSITKILIEDSPNRPVSLRLNITNAKLKGLKDGLIKSVDADLDKRHVVAESFIPLLTLDGHYVMDGKFLVLPLSGNGLVHAKLHNVKAKLIIQADPTTKDGNIHWDVVQFDVIVTNTTRFETDFQNLFNGDQTLARPTQQALNVHWREFWEELRPALEETFGVVFMSVANTILSRVPEKDMFL